MLLRLRARGACCTAWHPGDMVQVAAFPLISHNIQLSQEGSYLSDAESIGSGVTAKPGVVFVLFPNFVMISVSDINGK